MCFTYVGQWGKSMASQKYWELFIFHSIIKFNSSFYVKSNSNFTYICQVKMLATTNVNSMANSHLSRLLIVKIFNLKSRFVEWCDNFINGKKTFNFHLGDWNVQNVSCQLGNKKECVILFTINSRHSYNPNQLNIGKIHWTPLT